MNISEIKVDDRVLICSGHATKEHAVVKNILDNGKILVRLSSDNFRAIHPQFILKSFGR